MDQLEITKSPENSKMTFGLKGRLDTTTAPQLETEINSLSEGVHNIEFDLKELEYISSAGLRVLLMTQKEMKKKARTDIRVFNVSSEVLEIFKITGFDDIINIEPADETPQEGET